MKRPWRVGLLLALILGAAAPDCFAEPKLSGPGRAIPRNAATAGGLLMSDATLAMNSAAGEAQSSTFTGGAFKLSAGLMSIMAQPGSVVAITTVTKSTGTMDLAWSAPGLDGFLGDVVNGQYRIDYSSDALHVFDPAVFRVAFATTVSPGAPQACSLTGLEANTTYYTRIYLADAQKTAAETSAQSDQSTLAELPGTPAIAGVFATSVTFAWVVPPKGAEGFRNDASSTNFGALLPGGVVVTSMTPDGLAVSLTVTGLFPSTTYYFKLASLNWQSELNYTTLMATCTLPLNMPPVFLVSVSSDAWARRLVVRWSSPAFPEEDGVLVQLSTNPITSQPVNGTGYPNGTLLADGSVAVSSANRSGSYLAGGLELDTTYFFSLTNHDKSYSYSMAVSTSAVLDLPPMMPTGLARQMSADGSSVTLAWNGVSTKLDGTGFKAPGAPVPWDLELYHVYRATGIAHPAWVSVATLPLTATSFVDAVPDPALTYYYRIDAVDGFMPHTDSSMVIDTLGSVYALGRDQITRLKIPAAFTPLLAASGNPYGKPLVLRAEDKPGDLKDRTMKSVSFAAAQSPTNAAAPEFRLPGADAQVVLGYATADGKVVPSAGGQALSAAGLGPAAVAAADASRQLAVYWDNGLGYTKLYGQVDPLSQTAQVNAAYAGNYQIRSVTRTAGANFDLSGLTNRAITPNGNGLNDKAVFIYDNPQDSAVSGKIFDIRGAFISAMAPGPVGSGSSGSLEWDGKSAGRAVPGGIYIYQIQAEGRTFTGTVVVIR